MATGATYLNSNVSLISNASIRYEGTLYSINPQEATITLSNVRSYGTEDRKVEKFLAPKDTLFEYIIFKANDIKELIVDEPFQDPAIVTATAQQRPNSTNNTYGSGFNDNLQANGQSSSDQQNVSINQASAPSVSSASQNDRQRSENSTPEHTSTSELSTNKQQKHDSNKSIRQQNSRQQHQNNTQRRAGWDNRGRNNNMNNYHQQNYQRYDRNRNNNSNYYHNNNQVRRGQYQNHQNYQNHQAQRGQYYRGGNGNNYRQDSNRGGFRSNQSYQSNQRYKNYNKINRTEGEKLKGFDDYDFESANNQFLEVLSNGLNALTISNDRTGTEDNETTTNNSTIDKEIDDANFYNKEKSFFDNISCEAIERSKGSQQKFDWKKEKSLNAETFGFKITVRKGPDGKFLKPIFYGENNEGQRFQNRRYNPHQQHRPQHQSRINSS